MTVSPRTTAGAAVLRSWGTRISVSISVDPVLSTTPRDPVSIAIAATPELATSPASPLDELPPAMTWAITIRATSAASAP